jgi:hypothetical protein
VADDIPSAVIFQVLNYLVTKVKKLMVPNINLDVACGAVLLYR